MSKIYGVSLSGMKRWCRRYDGTWQSLRKKPSSSQPSPPAHCRRESISHEPRPISGTELSVEKIQIGVKEVPYACLRRALRRDGKHLYRRTAIDECTRVRFVYGFEEHTPENTVKFPRMLIKAFPFPIKTIQTDNGTEFTYKFISETEKSPMDRVLEQKGIAHVLISPRTPWHNGKVERSHRNDQRYFYDRECFSSADVLNEKFKEHMKWNNDKTMRTLERKSSLQLFKEKLKS